jgi:NitT/TauT family transport system substrate-binding protein
MDTLDLVAQGAGFYRAEDLAVTKMFVSGAAEAADVVSSGNGDICPIGIEPLLTGYERGIDLRFFLARMARYTYVLAVLDDSPIATLDDFRGARIGVHTLGAAKLSGQTAVETALASAGLTTSDYSLAVIGFTDRALAELTSRRVDAAAFPFYELIPYQIAGTKLRTFRHPTLMDVPNAGYAASPATIRTRGGALGRFSRAIVKAALLVRLNPAASARLMLEAQGSPFTREDVSRYAQMLTLWQDELPARDPSNPRIGAISPEGLERYSRVLAENGITSGAVPVSAILTEQFIATANDFDRSTIEALARELPG